MQARRVVVAGLALLLLCGCRSADESPATPAPSSAAPTPRSSPSPAAPAAPAAAGSAAQARAELAALPRIGRDPTTPTYERAAFGTAWSDTEHNGCNQRDDVLLRDALPGTARTGQQGGCDHDVLAGSWVDPYTGRTLTFTDLKDLHQAQAIQIDHVVPLAEAWRSGAAAWSAPRRRAFASDLAELLAVDGPTNMGKGDDDPAAWRPRKAFQCEYAVRWIDTKARWALGVDDSERRALEEMLDLC